MMRTRLLCLFVFCIACLDATAQKKDKGHALKEKYCIQAYRLLQQKKYDSAMLFVEKTLTLLGTPPKKDTTLASMYYLKGLLYEGKKMPQKAKLYFDRLMHDSFEKLTDKSAKIYIMRACNHLGLFYEEQVGDLNKATKFYKRGFRICEAENINTHDLAAICVNLGGAYSNMGHQTKALLFLRKARDAFRKIYGENHSTIIATLNQIAGVYYSYREFSKALKYRLEALAIAKKTKDKRRQVYAYMNIGIVQGVLRDLNASIAYMDSSRVLAEKTKNIHPFFLMSLYNNQATNLQKRGDCSKAIQLQRKAVDLAKKVFKGRKHAQIAYYYVRLADISCAQNYQGFLANIQKSLVYNVNNFHDSTDICANPSLENYINKMILFQALSYKAEVMANYYESNQIEKYKIASIKTFELCNQLVDKIQREFVHQKDLMSIAAKARYFYADASRRFQRFGNLERSYQYAQKGKAASLRMRWLETQKLDTFPPLQAKRHLLKKIKRFSKQHPDSAIFYSNKYDQLHQKLLRESSLYNEVLRNQTVNIEQIQQKIDQNTAYIEYAFGRGDLFIYVITKKQCYFKVLDRDKDSINILLPNIEQCLRAIAKDNKEQFVKTSHKLYQLLVQPIKKHLQGKKKLIIIPHNQLLRLPFDVLLTQKTSKYALASDQPYLIKKYQIQYHFSSILWHLSQSKEVASVPHKMLAFAPKFSQAKALKTNQKEALDIAALFAARGKSAALTQQNASEVNFKKQCVNYQYLHLATHSKVNKGNNEQSYIQFSPDSLANQQEDGMLYLPEIYNLRLKARLVVLSSCEAGSGRLFLNEGVLSLGRAFLYAGARNVVYSLWEANDKTSPVFMKHFYKGVLKGNNYGTALHRAKQQMIANPRTSRPSFWAGFILIGK